VTDALFAPASRLADQRLPALLEQCAALHAHLCPRQVLGVRMGLLGGRLLGLEVPQTDKRLLAFVETDGCAADGVAVATGCTVGHRTLRVIDYGKVAVTLVDSRTERAFRIAPSPHSRALALTYAPDARSRWHAQLFAYQIMPDDELLVAQPVTLRVSLEALLSKPGRRVTCEVCGEEIINEREVVHEGTVLCRACAGERYYDPSP
jgi:formylmethanofuran dehydrogenase subunit E